MEIIFNKNNMNDMNDHLIQTLVMMVKTNPNDTELGKKVRAILSSLVNEQTNSGNKQLLKD
jgi:hypothetical protein